MFHGEKGWVLRGDFRWGVVNAEMKKTGGNGCGAEVSGEKKKASRKWGVKMMRALRFVLRGGRDELREKSKRRPDRRPGARSGGKGSIGCSCLGGERIVRQTSAAGTSMAEG